MSYVMSQKRNSIRLMILTVVSRNLGMLTIMAKVETGIAYISTFFTGDILVLTSR